MSIIYQLQYLNVHLKCIQNVSIQLNVIGAYMYRPIMHGFWDLIFHIIQTEMSMSDFFMWKYRFFIGIYTSDIMHFVFYLLIYVLHVYFILLCLYICHVDSSYRLYTDVPMNKLYCDSSFSNIPIILMVK